jgi:hypothetical protein
VFFVPTVAGGATFALPGSNPQRMPFPMLDCTAFANAGMGGQLATGMGAPGPNAFATGLIPPAAAGGPNPPGQQWTVEMWDPPGIAGFPSTHPGFPIAQMSAFRFNLDFRHDLVFWTNNQRSATPTVGGVQAAISAPAVGPPDPACCLYASVQTNTWTIRLSVTFAQAAPFAMTVVNPFQLTMNLDPSPTRIAAPVTNLEVRFPPAQPRLQMDAST